MDGIGGGAAGKPLPAMRLWEAAVKFGVRWHDTALPLHDMSCVVWVCFCYTFNSSANYIPKETRATCRATAKRHRAAALQG